jgi:hypothetical protein
MMLASRDTPALKLEGVRKEIELDTFSVPGSK